MGSLLWSHLTTLYLIGALAVVALILGVVVSPAWLWAPGASSDTFSPADEALAMTAFR